jgi:hypothetical protein
LAIMPISIYTTRLSSQLIVTVVDHVAAFDVGPNCRELPFTTAPTWRRLRARGSLKLGRATAQGKAITGLLDPD